MRKLYLSILSLSILTCAFASILAQSGSIESGEFHAVSLEGNLIGDSPERNILVYLPPGYERQKNIRYPVIYFLQGFAAGDNAARKKLFGEFAEIINRLIAAKKIKPIIFVTPDGNNKFGGSFYTNSITTGNWEDYIVRDSVSYIDKKYRTIAKPESRGIGGFSMGGYGAIKLAMKHPDVFGAVYGTSPCCLNLFPGKSPTDKQLEEASAVKSWEDFAKLKNFFVQLAFAYAPAFSPNPSKPPFFADFPFSKTGETNSSAESAKARWLANIPNFMVDQYRSNLSRLRGIAFDAGTKEEGFIQIPSREFSETLKRNRIEHSFEVFEGGHGDKLAERMEKKILPFFSQKLAFETSAKKQTDARFREVFLSNLFLPFL
ncbi:alpha/beta hydrolase family protein [soil metagenome]